MTALYPVSSAGLREDPDLPEERLIALTAFASGVAITITPTLLGVVDQVAEIRFAFALVPALAAGTALLHRSRQPVQGK